MRAMASPTVPTPISRTRMRLAPSAEDLAQRERHVGGPLGEATQVPRVPGLAVRDEGAHLVPLLGQSHLVAAADAVQHLDLEARLGVAGGARVLGDTLDEVEVVGAQAKSQVAR